MQSPVPATFSHAGSLALVRFESQTAADPSLRIAERNSSCCQGNGSCPKTGSATALVEVDRGFIWSYAWFKQEKYAEFK